MSVKKPLAMFFNGSPRKNWNTHKMLEATRAGAESAGADTEMVHLYDIDFKGCKSCFACKVKGAKTNGVCAIRDGLRPVLERAYQANVIVIGSPIYLSEVTGEARSFMERFLFPLMTYLMKDGKGVMVRDKVIPSGLILTMNCPKEMEPAVGYPAMYEQNRMAMERILGACELLVANHTYQFSDYSRYDFNYWPEEEVRAYRDAHFDEDLAKARALGKRLVEMAQSGEEK